MSLFTRLCHTVLDRDYNAAPWLHSSLLLSRTDSSSHASLLTSYKMSFVTLQSHTHSMYVIVHHESRLWQPTYTHTVMGSLGDTVCLETA